MKNVTPVLYVLFFIPFMHSQEEFQGMAEFLEDAAEQNLFSGVVAVTRGDVPVFQKAVGYSDWEKEIPNDLETRFNIGSIGKLFTRIMIMQLAQEGSLKPDAPIKSAGEFYGDERDDKIKINQLINFTAGTGDYFNIPEYRKDPSSYKEVKNLASLILRQPLLFEPGSSRRYSNSGYVLLGFIIEKLTGRSYRENLDERIIKKLGLTNTGFIYNWEKAANKAEGYELNFRGDKRPAERNTPHVPSPAGGIYSNAGDLLKIHKSLMDDNELLKDEQKVIMFSDSGEKNLSWSELKMKPGFGNVYAGGSPGWNAIYGINAGGKYTVIILSNYTEAAERLFDSMRPVFKGGTASVMQRPLKMFIYQTLRDKGREYIVSGYKNLFKENGYVIEGDQMQNLAGYEFLQNDMIEEAIVVFKINTELFPGVANTFDSLGEAYLMLGNKKSALENYIKAYAMDPDNQNAKRVIENLRDDVK